MKIVKPRNTLEKVERAEHAAKTLFWIWAVCIASYVFYRIISQIYDGAITFDTMSTINRILYLFITEASRACSKTFPIFLFVFMIGTFVTSFRIFASRNMKNLLAFLLVIVLAVSVDEQVGGLLSEAKLNLGQWTLFWQVIIAATTAIAIYLFQKNIPLLEGTSESGDSEPASAGGQVSEEQEDLRASNQGNRERLRKRLGILITIVVSIGIALIFLFRLDQYEFITSGVILGILAAGLVSDGEKIYLGVLYFVDSEGAEHAFRIASLRAEQRQAKQKLVELFEGEEADKERRNVEFMRLVFELQSKIKTMNQKEMLKKLREMKKRLLEGTVSDEERRYLSVLERSLEQGVGFMSPEDFLLPMNRNDGLSLGEKVSNLRTLSIEEIDKAISEGLISEAQRSIWRMENTYWIVASKEDFVKGNHRTEGPLIIPSNLESYILNNEYAFGALVDVMHKSQLSNVELSVEELKGAKGLHIMRFETVTEKYVAVLGEVKNGKYPLYAIILED